MKVVCIGGACVDRKYHLLADAQMGTSNPVVARRVFGGVARNVAENLARLHVPTALISVVGDDENGLALIEHARRAGIGATFIRRDPACVTAEYGAVVDLDGELIIGFAEMQAIESITPEFLDRCLPDLARAQWIFADCNLSAASLAWCIQYARTADVQLAISSVSEPKVGNLPQSLDGVDLIFLNEREAAAFLGQEIGRFRRRSPAACARAVRVAGARSVILTLGSRGVAVAAAKAVVLPALTARVVDETGAGDALTAAVLFRLLEGDDLRSAARVGTIAAALNLESPFSVRPDLGVSMLA